MVHFYANNRYAINRTIFFTCEWIWFGILESYAIKRFMRLTGMQLAEVVCRNTGRDMDIMWIWI